MFPSQGNSVSEPKQLFKGNIRGYFKAVLKAILGSFEGLCRSRKRRRGLCSLEREYRDPGFPGYPRILFLAILVVF